MFSRPLIRIDENSSVSKKDIASHLLTYFFSLKEYKERYLHLFYSDVSNPPNHFAYVCPLCLNEGILLESTIQLGWHNEFSLDHFPPKSVGGFLELLVCKKCNNNAGGKYEEKLKNQIQHMSFTKGTPTSKLSGKLEIDGIIGSYSTQFTISDEGKHEIALKPNPKAHTPLLDKFIEDSKIKLDAPLHVTFRKVDESKVAKSLLKAAYLYCFEYWGYEFAFSTTGERIRKVLNDEETYSAKVPSFWLLESIEASNIKHTPLGLCYLQRPNECKCFIVNMIIKDVETNYNNLASVLIPNPTKNGWDDLKRIQDTFNSFPDRQDITMAHVTSFSITDNIIDGYNQSWKKLIDT